MDHRFVRTLPAIIWMVFIFLMSSQEQFPRTPGFSVAVMSVLAHIVLYGVLGLLISIAINGTGRPDKRSMILAVTGAALYGVTDEVHQAFVPGRNPSIFDLFVNTVGATISVVAWSYRRSILTLVPLR